MNAVQAAAVLGNFINESGVDPKADNGSYAGIAQWNKGGRYPGTQELSGQIEHVFKEMDGAYKEALNELWDSKTETDLAKATFAVARNYEVAIQNGGGSTKWIDHASARTYVQGWDKNDTEGYANPRWENAQAAYDKYKDLAPSSGGEDFKLTGNKVTLIGDSISVGAKSEFEKQLSGIDITAEVSKHFANDVASGSGGDSGMTILKQKKADSKLREIVIFALGTNDAGLTKDQIEKAVSEVGSDKTIVFVTNYDKDSPDKYSANNAAFREVEKSHNNIIVADWESAAKTDPAKYMADYVHPKSPDGTELFVKTIISAIKNKMGSKNASGCEESTQIGSYDGENFCQGDDKWNTGEFDMLNTACGPTSFATSVSTLTGKNIDPLTVTRSASELGLWNESVGAYHNLPERLAEEHPDWGVRVEIVNKDVNSINKALKDGAILWFCAGSNLHSTSGGVWTGGGHCGAIRGINADGNYELFDPACIKGRENWVYDPKHMSDVLTMQPRAIYKK